MKRKLIKQGASGLTVYVPKKWADARHLQPGDEVDIEETGDFLVIASKSKKAKEVTHDFTPSEIAHVAPAMTHYYRLGYDRIVVKGDAAVLREAERAGLPLLMGFEAVEKKPGAFIVENISEPSEEKFDALLRRVFLIVRELGQLCADKLAKRPANDATEMRRQLDKLTYFCKRVISKKISPHQNPVALWELLTFLMHIGHGYQYVALALDRKLTAAQHVATYLESVNAYYGLLYDAFYGKDMKQLASMNRLRKEIVWDAPDKLLQKGKDAVVVARIQQVARLIQLASGPAIYLLVE